VANSGFLRFAADADLAFARPAQLKPDTLGSRVYTKESGVIPTNKPRICAAALVAAASSCSRIGDVPPWWPGIEPIQSELFCPGSKSATEREHPNPERIRSVIVARYRDLRTCYEEFMRRASDVGGRVVVRFRISPTGSSTDACIWDTDINDQKLASCVLDKLEDLSFDSTDAGIVVRFPIVFAVARDDRAR
jgi:hypothetical protein